MDIAQTSRTAEAHERTLSEVARHLGVSPSRLHDYEDEGLIPRTGRESHSARLEVIVKGEKLGLSLEEIRTMLEARSRIDPAGSCLDEISRSANVTFGSQAKARRWLGRPTTALFDLSPLEVSSAGSKGVGLVLDLLKRIDHGLAV